MCPQSTNKGYEVQTTASNTGTWGTVLNDQVIQYLDENLGGLTSKSLSNVNVTLSASESRSAILRLTGVLTGNVQITTSCIGFFFVENLTTGAFVVTVRNASVATAATIAQGSRQTVLSDATNGCRAISSGFEAGVKAPFYMSTAPVGWTRDVTAALNNALPRLVTTGGAATGGTNEFTSINSNLLLTRANLPNDTITTTSNGAHTHGYTDPLIGSGGVAGGGGLSRGSATPDGGTTTSNGTHTHTIPLNGGVTQTAVNLNIKYADFLIAAKD
jgi:hypothetical protein